MKPRTDELFVAPERLRETPKLLDASSGFADAAAALRGGGHATFDGAWGSVCALLAARLAELAPATLVVVVARPAQLEGLVDDLALFSPLEPELLPSCDSPSAARRAGWEAAGGDRLRTLKRLLRTPAPRLVAATIQGLLQAAPSPESLRRAAQPLRVGQTLPPERLLSWLAEGGYQRVTAVELPGEAAARGGIVDVFPPDAPQPLRIEWLGDQIESLRWFDPGTQRSVARCEQAELTALERVRTGGGSVLDYLDPRAWLLLIEPEQLRCEGEAYRERMGAEQPVAAYGEAMRIASRFALATAAAMSPGPLGAACRLAASSVERFTGEVGRVRAELEEAAGEDDVFLVCRTEAEAERLRELLADTRVAARGALHFVRGGLQEGFRLWRHRLLVLPSDQLFRREETRRPRAPRRVSRPITSLLELRPGDLVVHLSHGVGRYRGMKLLAKDGQVMEHLTIEFRDGVKVYVPADKIGLVQKYVGGTKSRPALARVGGSTWLRQKRAVKTAVFDLAAELLAVQAERASRPGIAFGPDSEWQREFDASFPYAETGDQLEAIAAIKQDMERPRPMDRLLCGDVGFGKTEVAMRAAFKAVDNGYQVALLTPTTVLAEQHYRTFRERMAEFPFDIARLSRFCTPAEEREILDGVAAGRIDIVIGTHRLVSGDVRFHNLGLVIIDEEQRFGVEVKERLKRLRTTVDVMTMTATPIPRTLHMALVGLRDISNLETAPEDRLAVETRLVRFDPSLIRRAILHELNRGGQTYFVHNRVEDIELVADRLREIAPEARLAVAHGQMPESRLERVMVEFVEGKHDVLLATTIVENGLDIPRANTMFIDEADRYGLADLHQLRGRVGRYKHRAYCYLLVDPNKHVTPNAARRLRAMEEFSELGAGFAIAMRDLEIRGAGNLLGPQQSGHIAAVGYELYCQLLEDAVRALRRLPPRQELDVDLDLPGEAYLPDRYVPDMRLKIDLYRRLARVADRRELDGLRAELADRFGPPPRPAVGLLERAALRLDARRWRLRAVRREPGYVVLDYADASRIRRLAALSGGRIRVADERSAYLPLEQEVEDPERLVAAVKSVLRLA